MTKYVLAEIRRGSTVVGSPEQWEKSLRCTIWPTDGMHTSYSLEDDTYNNGWPSYKELALKVAERCPMTEGDIVTTDECYDTGWQHDPNATLQEFMFSGIHRTIVRSIGE